MTLSTYAHVVAELRDAPKVTADEQIRDARRALAGDSYGPKYGPRAASGGSLASSKKPRDCGASLKSRRGDSNPRPHHYE